MDFVSPPDLDSALEAKASAPGAQLLAGGTDLMVEVNLAHHRPDTVVGLRHVEALREINDRRIGACVTWARLEHCGHRALEQLARTVGSPQIRAAGTIGGNVGTASPAGDGLPWIAAVDAGIEVASTARGTRVIPWDQFFVGVKKTSIAPDEVILSVVVPEDMPTTQEFAKVGVRSSMVISTVSCVVVRNDHGFRVALGSSAPTPMRAYEAEEMINAEPNLSEGALDEFQRIVVAEVRPITDHRSTEAYRRHAAGVIARRLIERCAS